MSKAQCDTDNMDVLFVSLHMRANEDEDEPLIIYSFDVNGRVTLLSCTVRITQKQSITHSSIFRMKLT